MTLSRVLIRIKDRRFYWDNTLDQIFNESKSVAQEIEDGVKKFEVNRPTGLSPDFSRTVVGYFLFQMHFNCAIEAKSIYGEDNWKLIHQ